MARPVRIHETFTRIAAVVLLACVSGLAQQRQPLATSGCEAGTNYETAGFRIRNVRVDQPFGFLKRLQPFQRAAETSVTPLTGSEFRYATVQQLGSELESLAWLPDLPGNRVRVDLVLTSVAHCEAGELDVVYSIYSSQVAAIPGLTFESFQEQKDSPQTAAGLVDTAGRLQVTPVAGYNSTERFAPGIQAVYNTPWSVAPFLESVSGMVTKSSRAHHVDLDAAGEHDHDLPWLAHSRWSFDYNNLTMPALGAQLHESHAAAEFSAISQPLAGLALLRAGSSVEFGNGSRDTEAIEPSERNADYRSFKVFAGLVSRTGRNALTASSGLEIGAVAGAPVGWRKFIIDAADELSLPLSDHRALEVESRLSAGKLSVAGPAPAGVRFFGGNQEQFFTSDPEWQIRSSPFLRSIPANRFTMNGFGADTFIAHDLTVSYPIWNAPMVPGELTRDPDFKPILDGQLNSATSVLQTDYSARDPHFKKAAGRLKTLRDAILEMKVAVTGAETALNPPEDDPVRSQFDSCSSALGLAERRALSAQQSSGGEQYGSFLVLMPATVNPDGEGRLDDVVEACVKGLSGVVRDAHFDQAAKTFQTVAREMQDEFAQIDDKKAAAGARDEMEPAREIIHTLIYDANIFSIAPVGMFDVARLSRGGEGRTAYGVGAGVRLTLASYVNFTLGYVANPHRQGGDPAGAWSFAIRFRDLLN